MGKRPALTTPVILSLFLFTAVVPMPALLRGITVGVLATVLLFSWLRALAQGQLTCSWSCSRHARTTAS